MIETAETSGAGLLYAVRERSAFVVTANRLLRRDSQPRPGLRVRFRGVAGDFSAQPLEIWNEALDLGVLRVDFGGELPPDFPDPAAGPGWPRS